MLRSRRRMLALLPGVALAGCARVSSAVGGQSGSDVSVRVAGPDGERTFFDESDVATVGPIEERAESDQVTLAVELSDDGVRAATEAFRAVGAPTAPDDSEITLVVDGEERGTYAVGRAFANDVADGEWDGRFLLVVDDRDRAESIRTALKDG